MSRPYCPRHPVEYRHSCGCYERVFDSNGDMNLIEKPRPTQGRVKPVDAKPADVHKPGHFHRRLTLFQLLCSPNADLMLMSYTKAAEEERAEEARHKRDLEAIKKRKRDAVKEFLRSTPHVDEADHVSATLSLYSDAIAINVDPVVDGECAPTQLDVVSEEEEAQEWIDKYHARCEREEQLLSLGGMPLPDEAVEAVAKQQRTRTAEERLPKSPVIDIDNVVLVDP